MGSSRHAPRVSVGSPVSWSRDSTGLQHRLGPVSSEPHQRKERQDSGNTRRLSQRPIGWSSVTGMDIEELLSL